jgi:hypothetical protein
MKKENKAIRKIKEAVKDLGDKVTVVEDENKTTITVNGEDWRNNKPIKPPPRN